MQSIIGQDDITINDQLYGSASVDDVAMINADTSLTERERNAAIMDPDGYKFAKNNPSIIRDASNYPAIFENLKNPSKYLITRAFEYELQGYENVLKEQHRTMGPFEGMWRGFVYSRQAMDLNKLQAKLRDAIHDNNESDISKFQKEIIEATEELENIEQPNRKYWGGAGAVAASAVRMIPEMLATGVATSILAAASGPAAPAVAGGKIVSTFNKLLNAYRGTKQAGLIAKMAVPTRNILNAYIIYKDTSMVEGGAAYADLKKKHPDWSEEEVYERSTLIGEVVGAVESATAFFGLARIGASTLTGIGRRALVKGTVNTAEKAVLSDVEKRVLRSTLVDMVDSGALSPDILKSRTFISKLAQEISNLSNTKSFQVMKFGGEVNFEAITEVYQDKIIDIVKNLPQGEKIDTLDLLASANQLVGEDIQNIYDYMVNGEELTPEADKTRETYISTLIGSTLFGGAYKSIDLVNNVRNETHALGNHLSNADKTIQTFDTVLYQKKNSNLYGKSPETMQEFYKNSILHGEIPQTVYVDKDKLKSILDKMKNDPVAMAKSNALNLREKIADGEDVDLVSIPSEDFINTIVDPDNDTLYQELKENISTNPAMFSKTDAIEAIKKISLSDDVLARQMQEQNSIYNYVLTNQINAGADEQQASFNAWLAQSLINSISEQRGVSVEQVMKDINLRIENVDRITKEQADAIDSLSMFVGKLAESANLSSLTEAQFMDANGVSQQEILQKTGWFKDPRDENWKFEISDKDAELNEGLIEQLFSNKIKNLKLEDVLKHDKLYQAYPSLRDIPVIYNSHLRKTLGQFFENEDKIQLKKTDNIKNLKSTLLHEIQHYIQKKENFGRGGIPKGRNIELPMELWESNNERSKITKYLFEKLKQSGIKPHAEIFSKLSIEDAHKYLEKIAEKDEEIRKNLERFDELNKRLEKYDKRTPYEKYINLPGENEARDTQYREKLTEEERRKILPANLAGTRAPVVRFTVDGKTIEIPVQENNVLASIQFGAETVVRLSKIDNPTKFAHEMFHLFGMNLLRDYNAGLLNEHYTKNAETLADWAGFKKDDNGKYIISIKEARSAHEKIADGGIEYLRTGKAPAPYLKEIFDIIAEWFSAVYNAIRIKLNPNVTKVFDEIFIPYEKQKQILLERRYGFVPKPESMTEEQYANYIAEKRAAAIRGSTEEVKKAAMLQDAMSTESYKEEYQSSYQEAFEDLGTLSIYQMLEYVTAYKINKGSLSKISSDIEIPRRYISTKEGLDITQVLSEYPDVAETEDALAEVISTTPVREEAAKYIAEKHMEEWLKEKYPELADVNAEMAARNERVFRLSVMEYMMLSGIDMARFNQIHNDLITVSENFVQKMPLKKIANVQRWIEQESRLMQKYDYTSSKKEKAEIKRQQAILNYYAMRGKQLRTESQRFIRKSKKYRGAQTKNILRTIDGESFDLLKSLLGQFKLTKAKPNTQMPLSIRIDKWVESMANDGYTGANEIDRYRDYLVDGTEQSITTEQFDLLKNAFYFIESVAKRQKEIIVNGQAKNVEDTAQLILDEYIKSGTKPIEKELGSAVMIEPVLRTLWPNRAFLDYISPMFEGLTNRDLQISKWKKQLSDIVKPMYKQMQNKLTIDGNVYTVENLLVMMLNSGNKHNINCMVKTLQFSLNAPEYSVDDFFSALNQAPKELRQMTREIWKIFDDNKEKFQEAQRLINGKVLKFVVPEEYEFLDGETMPGGYYPAGSLSMINNFEKDSNVFKNAGTYATKSFQLERVAIHGDLDLTLGSLNSWFYKMSGVLHLAVPYNNISKLLKNSTFRKTVGEGMVKSINQWRQLAVTPERVNNVLASMNQLASVSILGLNFTKLFTQMSGIIPAITEIGPYWVMSGISKTNLVRSIEKASRLSPYMYARYTHPEDHLQLYVKTKDMLSSKIINNYKDNIDKVSTEFMFFVIYGDAIASSVTWNAAHDKAIYEGHTEKEASNLADTAVRMLQGDASAGSRPKIIQGNMRFFTMFATYFIGIHSLVKAHGMKGNEKAQAIGLILAATLGATMFESVFSSLQSWLLSDDEEKEKMKKKGVEDIVDLYLQKTLNNVLSTAGAIFLPHFGIGSTAGGALANLKTYPQKNIQLDYMMRPIDLGINLINTAKYYSEDDDEKATRSLKKGLQSIFEFSMINPKVANWVIKIIMGE